jgi:5-methylcytosine-specific restriction protein A
MPKRPPVHSPPGQLEKATQLKHLRQRADRRRSSPSKRGYDAAWQRLRKAKLASDPLCECDGCRRTGALVPADVVDHIEPIEERPDLRLTWSNLRSMAKAHHDRHTARTRGFGRARTPRGGSNLGK